ncbi:MAG TPA: hypothetical protein VLV56_02495 [Burkholderiales bacterium]|nr:hypothetical protein [Burkholderiales bacterium]
MSRTYRRRGQTHEYRWVLSDQSDNTPSWAHALLDRHSSEGRRAIARFHSDAEVTIRSSAPRWYRRAFDHRLRTMNDRQLRRWFDDPGYDPVTQIRHRHDANWSWW